LPSRSVEVGADIIDDDAAAEEIGDFDREFIKSRYSQTLKKKNKQRKM
jgi:hypothetical protein